MLLLPLAGLLACMHQQQVVVTTATFICLILAFSMGKLNIITCACALRLHKIERKKKIFVYKTQNLYSLFVHMPSRTYFFFLIVQCNCLSLRSSFMNSVNENHEINCCSFRSGANVIKNLKSVAIRPSLNERHLKIKSWWALPMNKFNVGRDNHRMCMCELTHADNSICDA